MVQQVLAVLLEACPGQVVVVDLLSRQAEEAGVGLGGFLLVVVVGVERLGGSHLAEVAVL